MSKPSPSQTTSRTRAACPSRSTAKPSAPSPPAAPNLKSTKPSPKPPSTPSSKRNRTWECGRGVPHPRFLGVGFFQFRPQETRLSALQNSPQNVQFPFTPMRISRLETSIREESGLMRILRQMSLPVFTLFAAFLSFSATARAQSSYDLRSPDNRIEVRIRTAHVLRYDALLNGRALLQDSTLSLDIDHTTLGVNPKVRAARKRSVDQTLEPPVRQKFAKIREHYNELRLEMDGNYPV